MRKVLSPLMIILIVFSMFSILAPQVTAQETTLFSDDFESYATGTFPSDGNWNLWFDGRESMYQIIVDTASVSGTKSLKLWGRNGLAAVAARPFAVREKIGFEVMVMVQTGGITGKIGASVAFSRKASSASWSQWGRVMFDSNGDISSGGQKLESYSLNTWYKVKVIYDSSNNTHSVWINNELKANALPNPDPPAIEAFALNSDYAGQVCYFDNVRVFEAASTGQFSPDEGSFSATASGSVIQANLSYNNTLGEDVIVMFSIKNASTHQVIDTPTAKAFDGQTGTAIASSKALPPGIYNVFWQAFKASDTGFRDPIRASPDNKTVLILEAQNATGNLQVLVKDQTGSVISGANLISTNQPSGQAQLSSTTANGQFTWNNILTGSYVIQASKSGYDTNSSSGTVYSQQTTTITITLTATPTLRIQIEAIPNIISTTGSSLIVVSVNLPSGDSPISGASVSLSASGGSLNQTSGTTGLGGQFIAIFTSNITGTFTINASASKSSYNPASGNTEVTVTGIPKLDVLLTEPANGDTLTSSPISLRAKVTSGADPVYGAGVKFYVDGMQAGSASSDQNGFAFITYAPAQGTHNWYVNAEPSGYMPGASQTWSFTYAVTPIPTPFEFEIYAEPLTKTIKQGESASYKVSAAFTSGSLQRVSLSLSGLPSGALHSFSPPAGYPEFLSTLTIITSNGTLEGQYMLTITGSGGGTNHSTNVMLTVEKIVEPASLPQNQTSTSLSASSSPASSYSTTPTLTPSPGKTDTKPPKISVTLSSSFPTTAQNLFFTVIASDYVDGSGITNVTLYVDGSPVQTWMTTGTFTYSGGPYSQGIHTYYVEAFDNANNVAAAGNREFTVYFAPQEPEESGNQPIALGFFLAFISVTVVGSEIARRKRLKSN